MGNKSFVMYLDWRQHLDLLTLQERGEMITAIYDYSESGIMPKFDGSMKMCFSFIKAQLDRDAAKYEAICAKNRENALLGGAPTGNKNAKKKTSERL